MKFKYSFILFIILIFNFAHNAKATIVIYSNGSSSYFNNLESAVADKINIKKTIVIDKNEDLNGDTTIPSNTTLKIIKGGRIRHGKYIISINGPFNAGLYRVFEGMGPVLFGRGSVLEVYSVWFDSYSDTNQLQSAINSISETGGTVLLEAKTYNLEVNSHPNDNKFKVCLWIYKHIRLKGMGFNTVLKLQKNAPNQSRVIMNYELDGTNVGVKLEDFTVDGNSANQSTTTDRHVGILLTRTHNAVHNNVKVKNVKGTSSGNNGPNGTVGEGMHFETQLGSDTEYNNCIVDSDDDGVTSTGFSNDVSDGVVYNNCLARGMKLGNGFTTYNSKNIRYMKCSSIQNRNGFNVEISKNVEYISCAAGLLIVPIGVYGYSSDVAWSKQDMGNSSHGFVITASAERITLHSCASVDNKNGNGVFITKASSVSIYGGNFSGNSKGIALTNQSKNIKIFGNPLINGNIVAPISTANGYISSVVKELFF